MSMPARTDHDARRRDVSRAVWRVLATHGFGGLTLRAVAAEMGASTGLLTHYFPTKSALVRHAHDIAEEVTAKRRRTPSHEGLAALREALLDVLSTDEESAAMNRVWVSFWDPALAEPDLAAAQAARYARWRGRLRPHVVEAQRRGELPAAAEPDDLVATAAAFTHGLVVQALFAPDGFPPDRQVALLDGFLDALRSRRPKPPAPGSRREYA
jgi:AcrR family transcriptional regulator